MTFNVQNLVSSLNRSGLAKSSHFEVEITGPGDVGVEREILYRADTAELPGRTITTADYKFGNYGPLNKVPYNALYGDVTIGILVSEDLREKEYFEIWQDKMINTGAFEKSGGIVGRANSPFNVKYFDDYIGVVTVRQYGSGGELRSIHTFNECYPIILQPVVLTWGDDTPIKINVTFAYKNYKVAFRKSDQSRFGKGFSISIGPGGIAGSVRIPGIGTIAGNSNAGGLKAVTANLAGIKGVFAKIRK